MRFLVVALTLVAVASSHLVTQSLTFGNAGTDSPPLVSLLIKIQQAAINLVDIQGLPEEKPVIAAAPESVSPVVIPETAAPVVIPEPVTLPEIAAPVVIPEPVTLPESGAPVVIPEAVVLPEPVAPVVVEPVTVLESDPESVSVIVGGVEAVGAIDVGSEKTLGSVTNNYFVNVFHYIMGDRATNSGSFTVYGLWPVV